MSAAAREFKINSDIEVLRAIAVILTILTHIPFFFVVENDTIRYIYKNFAFGYGVDLFFCVSGFVITQSILRRNLNTHELHPSLRMSVQFYIRRVYRIIPSSFLWLAIYLVVALCAVTPVLPDGTSIFGNPNATFHSALAAIMSMANLTTAANDTATTLINHYWSLSLEEQFYLVYPLALFLIPRKKLLWGMIFLLTIQFFISRPFESVLWRVRTDAIIVGCLIAFFQNTSYKTLLEPKFMSSELLRVVIPTCIVVLLCYVMGGGEGNVFFSTGVLGLLCGAIVFVASYDKGYVLFSKESIIRKIFVYIGSRSYAIYLTHMMCLALSSYVYFYVLMPRGIQRDRAEAVCVLLYGGIQMLFAELNYQIVEQPLRNYGKNLAINAESQTEQQGSFKVFPSDYAKTIFKYFKSGQFRCLAMVMATICIVFFSAVPEVIIWPSSQEQYIQEGRFDIFKLPPYSKGVIATEGIESPEYFWRFFNKFVWMNGPLAKFCFYSPREEKLNLTISLKNVIDGQTIDIYANHLKLLHIDNFNQNKEYVVLFDGVKGLNTLEFTTSKWNGHLATLNPSEPRPLAIMATKLVVSKSNSNGWLEY